jgi:endonuclease/exonuclease/phosphatase family metal-dependent hydrolase
MEFAFGTYNFEYGGFDDGADARLRRQLAALREVQADVWAFQECSGWLTSRTTTRGTVEQALGMRGFFARSNRGPGGDLAVFVRESSGIRMTREWHDETPSYHHAVAHIVCELDGYGPIRFASAHLAPSSPEKRAEEAESFQLIADKRDLGPLIAGGDFNALSMADPHPGDLPGITAGKLRRKTDRRAALALAEWMTDVGAYLGVTTPTVGHRPGTIPYQADRIYTTLPGPAITGYRVIHEDKPESDHRPAVATFTLSP